MQKMANEEIVVRGYDLETMGVGDEGLPCFFGYEHRGEHFLVDDNDLVAAIGKNRFTWIRLRKGRSPPVCVVFPLRIYRVICYVKRIRESRSIEFRDAGLIETVMKEGSYKELVDCREPFEMHEEIERRS